MPSSPTPRRARRLALLLPLLLGASSCTFLADFFDDVPFEPNDDVTAVQAPRPTRCVACLGSGKQAPREDRPHPGLLAPDCPECRGTGWR